MTITVVGVFPEALEPFFQTGILGRSVARGIVSYRLVSIRDFALDKHITCDDTIYGGGVGMLLKPGPVVRALEAVGAPKRHTVFLTPVGHRLDQAMAEELARLDDIVLLCGRYEGVDQRVIDAFVDREVSVGDYVLSCGETAAMVLVDAVYRLLPGVINADSLVVESFSDGGLEHSHYTRPAVYRGMEVPEVLVSGNHAAIERWRVESRTERTRRVRTDTSF